jgi:O-antigen/teichoic acid export membrane protein
MSDRENQALRDIIRGTGITGVGLVLELLVSFLAQILAARYLSVDGFGGLVVGMAVIDVAAIVGSLGLDEGFVRFLPRYTEGEKTAIVRTAYLVCIPVSLVVGAVVVFGADTFAGVVFDDPRVATSLRVFGLAIPFATALQLARGGIRGQKVPRYNVYVENLLRPLSRAVLVTAAVVYGVGQLGLSGAYALPFVLASVVAVPLFWTTLASSNGDADVDWVDLPRLVELLEYSLPFSVAKAAWFVLRSIDVFLILSFLGAPSVGVYGAVYAFSRFILMFSTAANFLGAPVASELEAEAEHDGLFRVNESLFRWLGIVSVPALAPFLFFPGALLSLVYRPAYATGASALVVLAIGFAVHNVLSVQENVLRAYGAAKLVAANHVAAAAINVVLNVLFIPRYGIVGAALATAVAYAVSGVLALAEIRVRTGRLTLSRRIVMPFLVGVPVLGLGAVVAEGVPRTLPWIVGFSAVIALAYWSCMLSLFGLSSAEVMLVRSVEERYGLRLGPLDRVLEWFT